MTRVRAAFHVHSCWSYDGSWPLEKLADVFSRRGYHVVGVTEHDQGFDENRRLQHREACQKASTKNILLLPGIEYSDPLNAVHLLVWGDVPFVGFGAETATTLAAAQAARGVVVFAHPSRRDAWKLFNPEWGKNILGVELWNRKTDGWAPSRDAIPLLESTRALPFVGLDFHDSRQFFPLALVMEVEPPINEASVLSSLRSNQFYSESLWHPIGSDWDRVGLGALRAAEFLRRKVAALHRKMWS
jgi:hypothetical protein